MASEDLYNALRPLEPAEQDAILNTSPDASIVAIATALGQSSIAIVRISGKHSWTILEQMRLRSSDPKVPEKTITQTPRRLFRYDIFDTKEERLIDRAMAVFFQAPHSYTGEDVVELSLHGNMILVQKVLSLILETGLARLANPGEFTQRAFLNQKLDLSQAEAVHRIITARSEWELQASQRNLQGELGRLVAGLRSDLIHLKANIEACIDFELPPPEQESMWKERTDTAQRILGDICKILEQGDKTRSLNKGLQVAIIGAPNAGKSSLFNRMLGWDRSIVSKQAGTTRDYISEEIQIDGLLLRIIDTAGLREAQDSIEKEGIARTHAILKESTLILHVIDATSLVESESSTAARSKDKAIYQQALSLNQGDAVLQIVNKVDLGKDQDHQKHYPRALRLSCLKEIGLDTLKQSISRKVQEKLESVDAALLLEERHRQHFIQSQRSLRKFLELCKEKALEEILTIELDNCITEVAKVTHPVDHEEVLGRVFSLFCVGK